MDYKKIWDMLSKRKGVTEVLDPTPVAAPFKFTRPKSLSELVREAQFSQVVRDAGYDTFEDFDDFEVEDENDMSSEHELVHDPDLEREVTRAEKRQMDMSRKMFDAEVARRQKEEREYKKFKEREERDRKKADPKEGAS